MLLNKKLSIQKIRKTIQNFKLLEAGRVDYAIIGLYPGFSNASITGFDDKIEILPRPILVENFYMTFPKKSKFKPLLPKVNKIIQRLIDEGTIEKWVKKYQDYYKMSNRN